MTTASRIAAVPRSTLYRIMGRNGYAPGRAGTNPSAPTARDGAAAPFDHGQSHAGGDPSCIASNRGGTHGDERVTI